MKVTSYTCTSCGDILYGRCSEDSVSCICGRSTVNGSYDKPEVVVNGNVLVLPELKEIDLENTTPDNLFWDWDLRLDKYGVISEFTHTESRPDSYSLKYSIDL